MSESGDQTLSVQQSVFVDFPEAAADSWELILKRTYIVGRASGPSAPIAERSEAPTEGLPGRDAGTDHADVVHDHRHGNSGRISARQGPEGPLRRRGSAGPAGPGISVED